MALKKRLTATEHEGLDAALRALYTADGDGFVLDVEGDDGPAAGGESDVEKLAREAREAADAAVARATRAEAERDAAKRAAESGAKAAGDTNAALSTVKSELDTVMKELAAERSRADSLAMGDLMRKAATSAGVPAAAFDDVFARAERAGYKVNADRNAVEPVEGKGVEDFLGSLKEGAPHLFGRPSGSGDTGAGGAGADPSRQVRVKGGDLSAVADNLEAIASGKMTIVDE